MSSSFIRVRVDGDALEMHPPTSASYAAGVSSPPTIRAPRFSDTAAVYRICFETAYTAEEIARERPTPELAGHVWAGPYLAYAPEWCRIEVDALGPSGYLLAVPSTTAFDAWADEHWWPALRTDHPVDDPALSAVDHRAVERLASPPRSPAALLGEFPAHLHIDLLERARGRGLARTLIDDLIRRLRAAGVPGVHLGVDPANTNAIGVYEHLGFTRLRPEADVLWMGRRTDADRP